MKYSIYTRHKNDKVYLVVSIPPERERLIFTGVAVPTKHWDGEKVKGAYASSKEDNLNIATKKRELESIILKAQFEGRAITAREVKEIYENKDLHNIFEFVEQYIKDHANKRDSATLENYRKHTKRLKDFSGSNLSFEQITPAYLLKYEEGLFADGLGVNYVSILMRTLNQMFLAAIKKGIIAKNPFDDYERPKYKSPEKQYLTIRELEKWEEFADETTDQVLKQTAIYFLLGAYSGLRVSDWFKFSKENIHDGWIRLRPKKKSTGYVRMKISKPLARNLKRMENTPLDIEEPTINEKLKKIATRLKINKHITTHTGRHTFAVTICLNNKVSSETAAELMGITLKTFVDNYSQVTEEKIERETKEAWAKLK